jgi:hypothetical protein
VGGEEAVAAARGEDERGSAGRLAGPWSICADMSVAFQPAGFVGQTAGRHGSAVSFVRGLAYPCLRQIV